MTLTLTFLFALGPVAVPPADTIRIEVGSPLLDGSVYQPHRARVRVHLNSLDTPPRSDSAIGAIRSDQQGVGPEELRDVRLAGGDVVVEGGTGRHPGLLEFQVHQR
jgi:hypothetical protein